MTDATYAISTCIKQALTHPSVRVGQRLLSERQLASQLKMTHAQVRKSLLHLVDEGLLIQKRGSGTFVRRKPEQVEQPISPAVPNLSAVQIVHQSRPSTTVINRPVPATHYDIGVWWNNLETMTPLQQMILAAMVEQAESLGHRLSFHSFGNARHHQPLDLPTIRQRFMNHRNDGYLCIGWCDPSFRSMLLDELHVPVVFFDTIWRPDLSNPHVVFNHLTAQETAQNLLTQIGCQNIWEIKLHTLMGPMTQAQGQYQSHEGTRRWFMVDSFEIASVKANVSQWIQRVGRQNIDGLYVADDHLLPGVAQALSQHGLEPGKDIAVIIRANKGLDLHWPAGSWSVLEFDPEQLGTVAVDLILQRLTRPDYLMPGLSLSPNWIPRDSHQLKR